MDNPHPDSMFADRKDETRRHEVPYTLEVSAMESLSYIRKKLEKGYTNIEEAHEHHSYLEGLQEKLKQIYTLERSNGIANEALLRHMREVSELSRKVKAVIETLS